MIHASRRPRAWAALLAGSVLLPVLAAGSAAAATGPDEPTAATTSTATTTVVPDGFTMVGNAATLQATVSTGATGTVAFSVDGTPLSGCGAQRLFSGAEPANTAYCATRDLPAGDHTVTAVYSGDAGHAPSTGTGIQRILKYASTTTLTASRTSGTSPDRVTFVADVAPAGGGFVAFTVDGVPAFGCQPSAPVDSGGGRYRATCTTLGIPPGIHTVTATWSGTDLYAASSGSVTYTVTPSLGTPRLTVGDASTVEGNSGSHRLEFTVRLSNADTVPITVAYGTSDGTAHAGSDYVATSGRLTIPAGSVYGTVTVPVTGDLTKEATERFRLTLSTPLGAVISTATATGTIVNDD